MQKNIIIIVEFILIVVVSVMLFLQFSKQQAENSLQNTLSNLITSSSNKTKSGDNTFDDSANPAQVLNLTNWKMTLPIGSDEKPTEVKQPVLATYKLNPWFVVTEDGKAVRFRAPVSSVTTTGSNYPRSELREMTNNGMEKASWDTLTGTHTMTIDQAITAVPQTKKHVVAGQIHDADDDIIVIRLEYPTLYVNVDGDNVVTLDKNYTLGKRFTVKFVVHNNKTDIYYNDSSTPIYTLNKAYTGAYFKAGAYTQSNCSREANASLCTDQNYGEVIIYDVTVNHQ